MSDKSLRAANSKVGSEIRVLAEDMLLQLEQGDVGKAVALVNSLNEVRDRTLYNEIGRLTRALHESIKNLNVDSVGAGSDIEDTTDKLAYVLEMTDKSANRTMDLVDVGMPLAAAIHDRAKILSGQWRRFLNKELTPAEFRALSKDVNEFLGESIDKSQQIQRQFSEIVLAQDFQDLTGQVIHKVTTLIKDVEDRLLSLVLMAGQVDEITGIKHDLNEIVEASDASDNIRAEGPQINKSSNDVVNSQDDVDDLLSSLGF